MSFRPIACAMVGTAFAASHAFGHASLVQAYPEEGAKVSGDALAIELRFDGRIDPRLSRLRLVKPDNSKVLLPLEAAASQDILRARASGLEQGDYSIQWQALSVDGHVNRGEIRFRLGG
jgi:copper resistance protein C